MGRLGLSVDEVEKRILENKIKRVQEAERRKQNEEKQRQLKQQAE